MRPKLLLVLFGSILGIEQGKLELELVREHIARVPKSLYKERLTVHIWVLKGCPTSLSGTRGFV